jgi:hypothetical protein
MWVFLEAGVLSPIRAGVPNSQRRGESRSLGTDKMPRTPVPRQWMAD